MKIHLLPMGARFELDGELRYAHRTSDSASLASTATITITIDGGTP